ncbi:MAG: TonB-dependent receptor [Bacteroidetes bacterium]|jgi:hypothetical protein|nr:TonB-dependent receptor [Bacteroidota bacterium]
MWMLVPFFISSSAFSQVLTQTLRGTLTDIDNKKPITGATIFILSTDSLFTKSDTEGKYRIENVPVGRYNIKISSDGYEEIIVTNSLIKSGKEFILNIELQSAVINLKTVEITNSTTANNEMITVSSRTFTVEETKRYPAAINDPGRMVMSYAGVASGNDRDNEIIIRGNSPKGLLWMLEGIEIPSPNHYSNVGTSTGSVSMLSSTMLANSDFMTGAFPAGYGNASSGVFDIRMRNGNTEKREYTFQAGVLGLEVGAEGPFIKGKGASYLFNYRYSTIAILEKLGFKAEGNAFPLFQDLSFKLFFPTKKAGIFTVHGLGGLSTIVSQDSRNAKETFDYNLGVLGITHQYRITDNTFIKSIVSFTNKEILYTIKQKISFASPPYYKFSFIDQSVSAAVNITSKLNQRNTIKAGIVYNHFIYNYVEEDSYFYSSNKRISMDEEDNTNSSQLYCSWKYRITNKISFVNGLHFLQLDLNKHYSLEPRSAIKWQIGNTNTLGLGFGIHSRAEPFQTYLDKTIIAGDTFSLNRNLDFTKARHYVLSYDKIITENLFLKFDIYYQQLYNVPVSTNLNSTYSSLNYSGGYPEGELTNKGTGENYGIELTIDKKFHRTYFFMITASVFESKYKAADGIVRNTSYNTNYVSNIVLGKEFWIGKKKRNIINTNIRANWTGGKPYTPIDLEKSKFYGYEVLYTKEPYSAKTPDYFRIDLQIGYVRNHLKYNSELRLDIQNLTNRKNVFQIYYDAPSRQIKQTYQLGLIPALSYRIEF